MPVEVIRLTGDKGSEIDCLEMEDGQIALVIKWGSEKIIKPRIVQRYEKRLIVLGEQSGSSYSTYFEHPERISKERGKYIVEILPNDITALLIRNNESED